MLLYLNYCQIIHKLIAVAGETSGVLLKKKKKKLITLIQLRQNFLTIPFFHPTPTVLYKVTNT